MKTSNLTQSAHIISALLSLITIFSSSIAYADGSNSIPVSMSVLPGVLTMYASDQAQLGSVTASHSSDSQSHGSLSQVSVDDSRGSLSGWNVSATFSNLSAYSTFVDRDSQAGPFSVHGDYMGVSELDLTLTTGSIVNGDTLDHIAYTLHDQNGRAYTSGSSQVLEASQPIGSTGLSFDAPNIEYRPDTAYHLRIQSLAASNYYIEPGLVSGEVTDNGPIPGLPCRPTDKNDPCTLMVAPSGTGDGLYHLNTNLTFNVPKGTAVGGYHGQVTETIL